MGSSGLTESDVDQFVVAMTEALTKGGDTAGFWALLSSASPEGRASFMALAIEQLILEVAVLRAGPLSTRSADQLHAWVMEAMNG